MSLVVILVTFFVANLQVNWVNGKPQVPCLFIFGDSLSDSGNNNNLITTAKCNFPPYGVDFPGHRATGRFTNGRTTIDLVGDHLGLTHYIKPYASIPDNEILGGVNYASGSAGILDETGFQVGDRIWMNRQVNRHKNIVSRIRRKLGKGASAHLNKCLYSVYVGSNDWMFNYFALPIIMLPDQYADRLIKQLTKQIDTILSLGAKKVIIFGMSPLGCLPNQNLLRTCNSFINGVLRKYNTKLKSLVARYNKRRGVKFVFINTMDIMSANNFRNLVNAGLKNTNQACCGITPECVPFAPPCNDRNKRVFWDQEHTTEVANKYVAIRAYNSKSSAYVYPTNIRALATARV